jgi:hypothetical protein
MNQPEQTVDDEGEATTLLTQEPPSSGKGRPRSFSWKRIIFLIVAFVAGILLALLGVLGYLLFFAADVAPIPTASSSTNGAISAQASSAFVTALIQKNINNAGLPGEVQNVQVSLTHNGPLIVTGDMHMSVLGIDTLRHVTVTLQPYISACQVHVHVLHVDVQGFPLPFLAQTVESKINEQMKLNVSGLPAGFTYCATNVRTETSGLFLTYAAVPD